ncbi:MAG: hypothetical protein WDN30_07885 [Pararobbsia sp.]
MIGFTSRIATVAVGLVAVALGVVCAVQFFEVRSLRAENVEARRRHHIDAQSIGTLKAQLAVSQADLASASAGVRACSTSVSLAAAEASAVRAAAAIAKATAARDSVGYQRRIDALTRRLQDPATQLETCDAAFERLRGSL